MAARSSTPRFIIGLITLVLVVVSATAVARAGGHTAGDRLEDARAHAGEARAEQQALAAQVAAQSSEIDSVEVRLASVGAEVASLERELSAARARLDALERELAAKTRLLKFAGRQLAVARTRLSERVVAIYKTGQPELVEILLGADSLDSVVEQMDARGRVLDLDARLVGEVTALKEQVTRERQRAARLQREQATVTQRLSSATDERRQALSTLVSERDRLASLRADRERALANVTVERREWEAEASALAAQSARVATIAAAAPPSAPTPSASGASDAHAPTPSAPPSTSTGFVWPVRGTIVSPYGQRWGRLHAGIDIAAPAGTPVVASAAGTVAYAGWMSGYGQIVVISHADGIATAYAHNSSISVSVGQAVGQGQAIAAVGCTGTCYGDHVHFEVRVGGSPVDPMAYL